MCAQIIASTEYNFNCRVLVNAVLSRIWNLSVSPSGHKILDSTVFSEALTFNNSKLATGS